MEFYAHSTLKRDRSDWQFLQIHSWNVGDMASGFAAVFGAQELARVQGLLHDLGKYGEYFQNVRLEGRGLPVDHSTWGAYIARRRYGDMGTILAYGIAGHHAGLANGQLGQRRRALLDRLSTDSLGGLPPLLPAWETEIELPEQLEGPAGFQRVPSRSMYQISFLVRMVFSCLVDADFIDTDNFYRLSEGLGPRYAHKRPSLVQLRDELNNYLGKFSLVEAINEERNRILQYVRSGANLVPGIFSLTVPTGGGKTLASMAFALDHAIAHGLDRIIYVIPFTSIVEQNAAVFEKAFGDLGAEAVVQHHSGFFDDPNQAPESIEKRKVATDNWDAPVIVTTSVQFFESLFADRPAKCRKLHNIAGSVVILDEAQTMPLDFLRPCVTALQELALNYRVSPVLCTATQPVLEADKGFVGGFEGVRELAPDPAALHDSFRRVTVRHIGELEDEDLISHVRRRKQVLCIVNNRLHARRLFDAVAEEPGSYHLSTFMYARHRSQVLAEIQSRLKENKPCRLISTSILDSGVNVSFPTVLRAEAGLDSIAQAAGRCNRENEWDPSRSEVLIFRPTSPNTEAPWDVKRAAATFRLVQRGRESDLLSLEALASYFQEVYWSRGNGLDKKGILTLLRESRLDALPMDTLAGLFKMMPTDMRQVIVPFDASGNEVSEITSILDATSYAPEAARKFQPYVVQVPENAYDALRKVGAIRNLASGFGEQFVRLTEARFYNARFGVYWDDPAFREAEQGAW